MISSESEWPCQGEYIDFKDKDNNPWQVGYVVTKAKNIIKVRSEGWSSKFDELMQVSNSTRIKPFRTIVRGYTGQVKNPALRDHWKFTIQLQQQNTQHFLDFVSELPSKSEQQIKQFLRGNHYFWIDFLLTTTYSSPEELNLAYDYLKQHIKFAKKYLEEICQFGIEKWCSQDPNIALRAYRESYYEIMDALYLLIGINIRQIEFQKNNDKVIKLATNSNLTHQKEMTKYMTDVQLDEVYLKLTRKLEEETFIENKAIPLPFLYEFFHIFAPIQRALLQKIQPPFDNLLNNKQQRKKLAIRIFNIIKKQIQNLTPVQLRSHQNEKEIDMLLAQIKTTYFKYGLEQLTFEWIERVKLQIAFLLMQSDILERKLKGITKLKDIYEGFISANEFTFKLKNQVFVAFLKDNRIIESLYQNNEHPEILKKGSEICQLLLKSHFIEIDSVISIWTTCSHKHQAVRKVIYQLWVDIVPLITKQGIAKFTEPIFASCNKIKEDDVPLFTEQWQIEILFSFAYNLIKQFEEVSKDRQQIDAIFIKFIELMYEKLVLIQSSNQIKQLIPSYAKLINTTLLCNKIIKDAYQSIAKNQHIKLNLELLVSFYQESFDKQTYLPSNALEIIFLTFQSSKNHYLSSIVFQLMDQIINFSSNIVGEYILTGEKFQNLWTISQQNEQVKTQFYSWLIKKNSDGLFGVPIYEINQSIPHDLKSTIFKNFLCDYNKLDYFNLSLEELHIFKEFLIFQNEQENRIQNKRLMTLIKIVRIKNPQILGNKFMWDIFLNCKNEDVIKQLSKIILVFHFNYHESINFKTKKAKIVNLMIKIEKHIREGFKKGNIKLMRHSLILLKDIIDFVKEKKEPRDIMNNYQQYFKTVVKVLFQNKKYEIQIFFGVTYYEIKSKIAELIKLERTKFEMFSMKNEEISLEFAQVPFCFMQEKTIKVVRVLQNEQTISNIVLNFIKDRIENTLIDMLQDETICENVYNVLQDIEIKVQQGESLLQKLTNIMQKHEKEKKEASNKYEIYIYLFYLRILQFMIEKPNFLQKFVKSKQLNKLVEKLEINVNNPLCIVYLYNSTDIVHSILKKIKAKQENNQQIQQIITNLKENLKEKCIRSINQVCHYINCNGVEEKDKHNRMKVRIIFNCLNIVEQLEKTENTIYYLTGHQSFSEIVRRVYVYDNLNEIRLIFSEKIKKFLQKNRELVKASNDAQKIQSYKELISNITRLFIGQLYYQIRKIDGAYSDKKRVIYLYKFIAFIIDLQQSEQFQGFIIQGNDSTHFYQDLLSNLKQLSDLKDATAAPNYILSSHLFILSSIYAKRPQLLSQEILHYLLYQCLFYKEGSSGSHDAACKKPETIKAALDVIQAGSSDYKNPQKLMKIVSEVQEFHRIDYWRTSDNWSTSIENEVKAKYVGLQNPGCICYLNSLLQQLFMTKNFRNAITSLDLKSEEGDTKLEMLKSLKQLFFNLSHSQQIALNPTFFTKTIKSHDNKPLIKIFVQMDIDQFCSILFDKVEHHLTFIPNQPNLVKNIFGGIYAHQIISKECKHSSEREEQFISIGLEVKKTILQSFNSLIKGEMLDGENKYYCEKCDKKVKAEKILTIKKLPQNLILSIKRFQYNYEIDAKIKINDYCQFPMELNLKKYSQQEINKANTPESLQISEENGQKQSQQLPDSYFKYKLKGVVVHTGSADSGHYYSFIEDGQKNWFEFNDSHVTPFDVKNLPQEAFGSKDSYEEKVKNAYLLFYERVEAYPEETQPTKQIESQQNSEIIHQIVNKNKTINKFRLLFSKDYSDFANYLLANINKFDLTLQQQERWHYFILSYYLLIKIREGSVEETIPISKQILKLIQSSKTFSALFLQSVAHFNFLQQIFVYGSNRDKVKILSHLLARSFLNYYIDFPENYNALKESLVINLLSHIKSLTLIHGNIYQIELFLQAILDFSKKRQDNRLFKLLLEEFKFEKCILVNLLSLPFSKEQKQLASQYKEQHKSQNSEVLSLTKNEGKKYLPTATKLSWQLIQYFIEYLEPTDITEPEAQQPEPLRNINSLLDKSIKNGSLTKIIYQCGISKSVYRLYKVFKSLNKAIEKGLKDFQSTKYRQLLILLHLIIADEETSEKLVKMTVEMLFKVHIVNEKYFLEVNLIYQWMLKFVDSSPLFLKHLSENLQFITQIVNWITAKPLPSGDLIKKHKNPANERLLNRLNGILVSADPRDYQMKSKYLKKRFEIIRDHRFQLINEHPQWQKQYLDNFVVQAQAYYYDMTNRRWSKVKVIQKNFGLLKLQQIQKDKSTDLLVWQDNERLITFKASIEEEDQSSSQSEEEIHAGLDAVEQQDLYN